MKSKRILMLGVVALLGFALTMGVLDSVGASREDDDLTLYGNVDVRQVDLGFRVAGQLDEVAFEEGDRVSAGTVVARLRARPFEDDVRHAKAEVAVRWAEYEKFQAGARPEEIRQAQALVNERTSSLRNAERQFTRQAKLVESGAVSEQRRDDAEAARDAAEARLNSALEALELSEQGFRSEDIAAAKAAWQVAEAQLSRVRTDLEDTKLVAPSDGIIQSRIREPGAIVTPGSPVYALTIADPVWVRTYVAGPDLGRVEPGMKAEIHTDTFPDRPYQGQVGFVSPEAEFTPRTVETPALRTDLVYRLRVIVENPDEALRQGMPVTVRLRGRTRTEP